MRHYLCVSRSASLRFSRHYGPKRWGWGEQRERCARARLRAWLETHRPRGLLMRLRRSLSSTLPPFPQPGLLRAPDLTLASRTRVSSSLPPPPTAPEAARGTTCVRFSFAGIATFLPGLWGFDRITDVQHSALGRLANPFPRRLNSFSPASRSQSVYALFWLPYFVLGSCSVLQTPASASGLRGCGKIVFGAHLIGSPW